MHFQHAAPEKLTYAINRYRREVERHYQVLDDHLTDRDYIVGDAYSIADMSAWGWLDRAAVALPGETHPLVGLPQFEALVPGGGCSPGRRAGSRRGHGSRLQAGDGRSGSARAVPLELSAMTGTVSVQDAGTDNVSRTSNGRICMFISRRTLLAGAAATTLLGTLTAQAAERKPFDQKAFEAAQKAGRPILVEITAPWCPTCKAQKPILSDLTGLPKFKDLQVFEVDFDSQKDVVRSLKAQMQSTLIAFRGAKEVGRSVGDTNRDSIEHLLNMVI